MTPQARYAAKYRWSRFAVGPKAGAAQHRDSLRSRERRARHTQNSCQYLCPSGGWLMDGVALGMLLSNRKIAATQKVLNHQRHADRIVQTRQWVFSTSRTRHVGGCLAELTLQIHVPRSHKELKCPSAPGRAAGFRAATVTSEVVLRSRSWSNNH